MNSHSSITAVDNLPIGSAGQVVSFSDSKAREIQVSPFTDNLDFLQSLEEEAHLLLARALIWRKGENACQDKEYQPLWSAISLSQENINLKEVERHLSLVEIKNSSVAANTHKDSKAINFPKFCSDHALDHFERATLILLFMLASNEDFVGLFKSCNFDEENPKGLKIGTLLKILCKSFPDQATNCHHFNINAPLIKHEILQISGRLVSISKIIDVRVSLRGRYALHFLGDQSQYVTYRHISLEKGTIGLGQVVLADDLKEEVVSRISSYIKRRENKNSQLLDDFFGYGTALTLLLHGPSGTGKTMLAQALSRHFDRQLFIFQPYAADGRDWYFDDELEVVFREASLEQGIVFFDEADDMFRHDSYKSRSLLIQLEKAHCIVILATNKPVELDPALERRISMKVHFTLPDALLRHRMWQKLIPDFVKLAPDVNLKTLSERHLFTGGLIKNIIAMAANEALSQVEHGLPLITLEMIDRAAQLQSVSMFDTNSLCREYSPKNTFSDTQLPFQQKEEFRRIAQIVNSRQGKETGMKILISSSDVRTGVSVVGALAKECGLKVKEFDYFRVSEKGADSRIIDPITQRKITPMEYAFAPNSGDPSLLLFVDHEGIATWTNNDQNDKDYFSELPHYELSNHLRGFQGLFCMLTSLPLLGRLPTEFHLHFTLEYPSEVIQMSKWEDHLGQNTATDEELVTLVERYPMHTAEIDFVAGQASILAAIKRDSQQVTIRDVYEVISRYRPTQSYPPLFGGSNGP